MLFCLQAELLPEKQQDLLQFDDMVALLPVGYHVLVREFYTLRRAFGTGTEDNRRHVVKAHLLED